MERPQQTLSLAEARVRRTYEAGRRAHGGVDLPYERFRDYALRAQPRHENGDYYLAAACDAGAPGAWERLQARFGKPLRALMRRRGASRHDVEQVLDDVWGRLASPPPRGAARTRIGTYSGQGPLLAWLSTVAWRRLTDAWRVGAGLSPLTENDGVALWQRADPVVSLAEDELSERVGEVLEHAWAALTDRELEVVVLKYRHLLPQQAIAKCLHVSPSRVTRLLQSATKRLRQAVAKRFELRAYELGAESNQAALLEILQRMLSQTDAGIERPEVIEQDIQGGDVQGKGMA